jgi:outer membrane protein assembly factor BamB
MRLPLFLIGPVAIWLIAGGCAGSNAPEKATATADFSLAITPTSQAVVPGTTGTALSLQMAGTNGFVSPVSIEITGLPAGVTANPASPTLVPGTAQNVTLSANAGAATGPSTVTFTGTAGTLSHAATLALTVQASSIPDVTTFHFDNSRDGLNSRETTLTPANVTSATFGKLGFFQADGKVDAQPLYLAGLNLNGVATNVLYVATEHGSVYAFNADTGAQLWKASLLGSGEAPSDDHGCNQITPEIGITSTPVIDRAKGAIFAVGMSKDAAGKYHQRLHALNLTTGADLPDSPTEITGSYSGTGANSQNGNVVFDPAQYAERAGLLLLNGTIYLAWTSHCDYAPYTGWVMAYSESTLQQSAILNLTPNGSDGSIWMAGNGLAADAQANIYFLDANGTLDSSFDSNGFPAQHDYGNAIVKLSTAGGTLAVADYFEPYNTVDESNADIDLGSGGAMLLPDMIDASGNVRHLLAGAGKDKNIYVADRDNLGKFNQKSADNSNVYQELPGALANGAWSSPAYFNGTVYYAGQNDTLKAFPMTQAKMATTPSSQSAVVFPYPGSTPSVSTNGAQNGIVWAVESNLGLAGVLHAYDATDLSRELYNSNQAPGGRDSFGNGNKFITPVIVNGKVFVGTQTGVAEFGLLP